MGRPRRNYLNKKTLTAAEIDIRAEYLKGNRIHTVERKLPSAKLVVRGGGVIPFALTPNATISPSDRLKVGATVAAIDVLSRFSALNLADLGIETFLDNVTGQVPAGQSFAPALWIPTIAPPVPTVNNSGTSAFTGRPTKKINSRSGSLPFGRVISAGTVDAKTGQAETDADKVDEEDVKKSVLNKVIASRDDNTGLLDGASFITQTWSPEEFYPTGRDITAEIGSYTGEAPTF